MRAKSLFWIFTSVWLVCLVYFAIVSYSSNVHLFIVSEILFIFSLIFFYILYQRFLKPIHTIQSASLLLKEKDFNTVLPLSGNKDLDELSNVYNQMSSTLREERIQHEEKNYFLDRLIDASPSAILIFGLDNSLIQANKSARKLFNLNDVDTFNLPNLRHPFTDKIQELELHQSIVVNLDQFRRYRIEKSAFMDKGFERHFVMIQELSEELRLAEKEAYGKVIRFMAHEVNNTVAAVNSIMQSLYENNNELDSSFSKAIEVSIQRNENLTDFMDNYAQLVKINKLNITEFNLSNLIDSVISLLQAEFSKNRIEIKKTEYLHDFYIKADKTLWEQCLINIIKNAIEAIEQNGEIFIHLDDKELIISNNGEPIPLHLQSKIFSPFFTSKSYGQGIGLTFIREVFTAHAYSFHLETNPENELTEFHIKF